MICKASYSLMDEGQRGALGFWANQYVNGCRITLGEKGYAFEETLGSPTERITKTKSFGTFGDLRSIVPTEETLNGVEEHDENLRAWLEQEIPLVECRHLFFHLLSTDFEMNVLHKYAGEKGYWVHGVISIGRFPVYYGRLDKCEPVAKTKPVIIRHYEDLVI